MRIKHPMMIAAWLKIWKRITVVVNVSIPPSLKFLVLLTVETGEVPLLKVGK
jgi:hypothetical protein